MSTGTASFGQTLIAGPEPYFWLQPAVTGGAALLVLLGAGLTVWQRYRADRKDQWWTRTQWALSLVVSGEEDQTVLGLQVLAQQAAARAADKEDGNFIAQVLGPLVDSYRETGDTETDAASGDPAVAMHDSDVEER